MIKFESLNNYNNFWSISDLHVSHRNIARAISGWRPKKEDKTTWRNEATFDEAMFIFEKSTRDFSSIEQMNEHLAFQINKYVKEDDFLLDCGDWNFSGKEEGIKFREKLNVKTIYSCIGNHDHRWLDGGENTFTKKDHIFYLQYKGQKIIACHYPFLYSFHQSHKGTWNLHGHVHGSQEGKFEGKIMDVGIDNTFNRIGEYKPLSFKEINDYMKNKSIVFESHHSETTN